MERRTAALQSLNLEQYYYNISQFEDFYKIVNIRHTNNAYMATKLSQLGGIEMDRTGLQSAGAQHQDCMV